jgi:methylmalonyl-CoA mutase
MAIQHIINKELGLARNENPLQGSFIVEELTDQVEAAVLEEFRSISRRGGVLGAMERMYQRSKIQEESLHYERLKHSGELPIVGVNTFLAPDGSPTMVPGEVRRSTTEEKELAISCRDAFQARNRAEADRQLARLKKVCTTGAGENIFETMLEVAKVCTLGQISAALYEVGGQYRRNM